MKTFITAALLLAALCVSACASFFDSPPAPAELVAIQKKVSANFTYARHVAVPDPAATGDIPFTGSCMHYALAIKSQLARIGYSDQPGTDSAHLVKVYYTHDPFSGQPHAITCTQAYCFPVPYADAVPAYPIQREWYPLKLH